MAPLESTTRARTYVSVPRRRYDGVSDLSVARISPLAPTNCVVYLKSPVRVMVSESEVGVTLISVTTGPALA